MSYFYENSELKNSIEKLPDSIKSKIIENSTKVNSYAEMNELIRRVINAETDRIL